MAETDAEKKNIAKLDFTISDAINSLDLVDKKLKSIAESSSQYAEKIGKNINKNLDINKSLKIDTTQIKKNYDNVEDMVNKYGKTVTNTILKGQNQAEKAEQEKALAAQKSMLAQEQYNERIAKSTETLYDKITQYAKTYVIYQGFNALKKGIQETIDEMVEVEQQMVAIDRILSEDSLNIDKYRDKLIQLAYDYGNSFKNVADITLRLAQAGFDSQEAIALTEKTLLALNTAELDATQATDDMVAVMAQWGLMTGDAKQEAADYASIIDKINKVADNFPTTSADLMDALKKVSSAFNLAGASIDETIALIVAAEKTSQRGGKVIGTALSNIVQQIKAEGKLNLAEQLGLDFYTDSSKTQFKNVIDIFKEMAERMQALKDAGKESSVEMQSLLELFTVFRRNIGASLLGEMSGEDNTYLQALETSINSVGYSLQENEKYMRTAKAAQEQLNSELLKLKTQVWEGGLEDAFRNMLSFGSDLIKNISGLIEKVGLVPTAIGAVVAAYTVLNNKIKVQDIVALTKKVSAINATIKETGTALTADNKLLEGTSNSFKKYATSVENGKVSLVGYGAELVSNTAKTALLTAGTIALNAAISFGLSAAITFIVSSIDNWIHTEERAIEANKKLKEQSEENARKYNEEVSSLKDLAGEYETTIREYKKLKETQSDTTTNETKLYELQTKINEALVGTGKYVNIISQGVNEQGEKVQIVNDKYDEQLSLIKTIAYEKKRQQVEELKEAMEATQKNQIGINTSFGFDFWNGIRNQIRLTQDGLSEFEEEVRKVYQQRNDYSLGKNADIGLNYIDMLDFDTQKKVLQDWLVQLNMVRREGKDVSKALDWVKESLKTLEEQENSTMEATNNYKNALSELYAMSGQIDTFNTFLDSISNSYNLEGPNALIESLKGINQQFSDGQIDVEQYFNKIQEKISEIDLSAEGEELEAYQAIFAATTESLAEGISELNAGLESGTINFADYASGTKEAAENMLALRKEQNNLTMDSEGLWRDAGKNIDEYANSLQNAINEMSDMGDLLKTIGDNYNYIAENSNAAGEAMFRQSQVGTEAYTNLANNVAASLAKMNHDNNATYDAITKKIFASMGKSANEVANADAYISEALSGNAQALNAALNESANQVAISTNRVTVSMGNVLSELGNAISNFKYDIKATPYITGGFGLQKDENGLPTGIKLPTFGFDIVGNGGDSIKGLGSSLKSFGSDLSSLGASQFRYTALKSSVKPYTSSGSPTSSSSAPISSSSPSGSGGSGRSGGSGGSSGRSSSTTTDNSKAEQEEYKNRLNAFKNYITERERLETRWVKKQKELGQLSNKDYLYITQQRIERYKKYLDEVQKATWMSEEDRLALANEYSEKIEDLQLDYLDYLQDKLKDEQDLIKKNNKERIDLIKQEADERINALKKVENENDRIRTKEEYEKKRQEHLNDISYWEQRTGREAQEALKEARKNLQELDEEWKEQLEDWSIDDQIKAIENERDAQIKAIEDAQQTEIDSIQAVYDAKVKAFAETGQIIYEGSTIQSQKLYQQYKSNFIDPITNDLSKLNKVDKPAPATTSTPTATSTPQQQYETYLIKRGDTLSKIASKYGTTVDKIMQANPYIKNKNLIYAGKTLQIPKFHEGGVSDEGLAVLKKNEMILKPEWTPGMLKLMKYVDKNFNTQGQSMNTGNAIQVTRKFS